MSLLLCNITAERDYLIVLAQSYPDVAGGNGLPSDSYNFTVSSTSWHNSANTSCSSSP